MPAASDEAGPRSRWAGALPTIRLAGSQIRSTFSGTAPDLRVDACDVPDDLHSQHSLDKSRLPEQRLRVTADRGETVEPARSVASGKKPVIVVKSEWRVVPDSGRRARLLAAMFGDGPG
jgi:hypothetical protein